MARGLQYNKCENSFPRGGKENEVKKSESKNNTSDVELTCFCGLREQEQCQS